MINAKLEKGRDHGEALFPMHSTSLVTSVVWTSLFRTPAAVQACPLVSFFL